MMSFLSDYLPVDSQIGNRYIEPFVGGGSVFFTIKPHEAILSDLNQELIDLYKGIQQYPNKVWGIYNSFDAGKEAYYKVRDDKYNNKPLSYRAARTLYLSRTCFKGMWRHSPSGCFNVGYGGEERRWVITLNNILELSNNLRKATILKSDFENVLDKCRDGDFVFIDPPYKPGERDLLEAHYTYGRFLFSEQERLANKLKAVSNKYKVNWLMTNSAAPEICDLYKNYSIIKIPKGTGKRVGIYDGISREVVIRNY